MTSAMRELSLALLALAVIVPARARAADSKDAAAKPAASGETGGEASGGEDENNPQKQNEKSGAKTLEERIRPVSGSLFIRKSRSELEPVLGISFNDAFFQKYMFGLRYAYHATDSFAVELGGAFGISMPSGEVNTCTSQGCVTPTKDQLQGTPGNVSLLIGASGIWSPLYGKMQPGGREGAALRHVLPGRPRRYPVRGALGGPHRRAHGHVHVRRPLRHRPALRDQRLHRAPGGAARLPLQRSAGRQRRAREPPREPVHARHRRLVLLPLHPTE